MLNLPPPAPTSPPALTAKEKKALARAKKDLKAAEAARKPKARQTKAKLR